MGRWMWMALAGVAGCSLVTSLDGLSGGAPGDGGAPTENGAVDAGGDVVARPPAEAGTSCASLSPPPRLCVDFTDGLVTSDGPPTATSFERDVTKNAAKGVIDRATFRSPGASVRFSLPSSGSASQLERTFDGPTPGHVELSMAMRIDTTSSDADIDLMEIRFGDDAGLFLRRGDAGALSIRSYSTGQTSSNIPINVVVPDGVFAIYAWVIEVGAAPTLTMTIDGKAVLSGAPLLSFASASKTTFIAGCTDHFGSSNTTLWVDDVIVRF